MPPLSKQFFFFICLLSWEHINKFKAAVFILKKSEMEGVLSAPFFQSMAVI